MFCSAKVAIFAVSSVYSLGSSRIFSLLLGFLRLKVLIIVAYGYPNAAKQGASMAEEADGLSTLRRVGWAWI